VVGADNVREATAALRSVLTQGGESA